MKNYTGKHEHASSIVYRDKNTTGDSELYQMSKNNIINTTKNISLFALLLNHLKSQL